MSSKFVAALIFATTVIMISSLDIYVPATPFLSDVFNVADSVMKMTFLLGPLAALAVSLPVGHYSDIYGRRPIFLLGVGLFIGGAAICTMAPNIYFFFLGRFILSIGGAGLNVLCGAILADLFRGVHLARYMGIYSSIFPIVFAISPIVGAQILTHWGWRAIFGLLTVLMTIMSVFLVKFLPETRSDHKKEMDEEVLHFMGRIKKLMQKSSIVILALAHAFPIAINGIFMVNSPFLFIETFNFGPVGFSIIQSIPIAFQFLGALCYRFMLGKVGPETGLKVGFITTLIFVVGVGMTFLGWIPQDPYLIVAVLSFFSFGATFVISSAATLLLDAHSRQKGLAMSVMVLVRNGTIFFVLSIASYLPDESVYPIFGTMVAVSLGLLGLIYRCVHFSHKVAHH